MSYPGQKSSEEATFAARCHEIQTGLGAREVPEYESITEIGMAVRLALHIRGLSIIRYEVVRLVASYFLAIPALAVERILRLLAEVQFVRLQTTGQTITGVLPTVPYYEDMYDQLGTYALGSRRLTEPEQLAVRLVDRLSRAPENIDALRNTLGAETKLFSRSVQIGIEGAYLIRRRCRGRDILLSPTYFSENADAFADAVAAQGAQSIEDLLKAISLYQGWPLALLEEAGKLGNATITPAQIAFLKRLAQDGAIKPPCIETSHAGLNFFLFTPTPSGAALSPTKRDIYEKAMAIVAAIRQGQLLPQRYAIWSPDAVLNALRTRLRLGKATTEAREQYKQLVHLRVGRLRDVGDGFSEFEIIDTPENREALDIAYSLVCGGAVTDIEVDDAARLALQKDQRYVESLIASAELRKRKTVEPDPEDLRQLEYVLMEGS